LRRIEGTAARRGVLCQVFFYRLVFCAQCTRGRVRYGLKAGGRDFLAAALTDAVQTERQSFQRLLDSLDLVTGGFSDALQGLVVLDLDGAIARVGQQWLTAMREITVDPALAYQKF
jgi:hypothetical protein